MENNMAFETYLCCQLSIGSVSALKHYGIYIPNNGLKMHGQPKKRKIAERKRARRYGV